MTRRLLRRPARASRLTAGLAQVCALAGLVVLGLTACGPTSKLSEIQLRNPWEEMKPPPAPNYPIASRLRLLIWRDYLDPKILEHFTHLYGVEFDITYFENNADLKRKFDATELAIREAVAAGTPAPEGFDLIMPSSYVVEHLIKEGSVVPINKANVPNLSHIAPGFFLGTYDRDLVHSVPLFYSYLGVAFNSDYLRHLPQDFSLTSASHEENVLLHGYRALLNEARITIASGLLGQGFDPNSTNPAEIRQVIDHLVATSTEHGIRYLADTLPSALGRNEILIAACWSGAAGVALSNNNAIRFLLPPGPKFLEIDSFVIPRSSNRQPTAEFFLNFLLVPEIAGALTNFSYYANTNETSRPFIHREIMLGPSYVSAAPGTSIFLHDLGDFEAVYAAEWQRLLDESVPVAAKVPLRVSPRTISKQDDSPPENP